MTKKLLCFAPSVGRGGVNRVLTTLLPELSRKMDEKDWSIDILGQDKDEFGHQIAWPSELPFTRVRPLEPLPGHPNQFPYLIKHAQDFVDHAMEVQGRYDLIWCPTPWWAIGAAPDVNFNKPLVVNIPDFAFDHINLGSFLQMYFRSAAWNISDRADMTIFSSRFQEQWAQEHYAFKNTAAFPYSLDFVPKRDKTEPFEGLPDRFLLAFHCMNHKDPITTLRGYGYARSLGDVPPLVMAGIGADSITNPRDTTDYIQRIRKIIHSELRLEHSKDLFVLGFVPEEQVNWLYQHAAATLVCTWSEGDLSGTMNEAIINHSPLIYGELPVFAERLTPGVHGLTFTLGEYDGLGKQILEVLANPKSAARRAKAAYEHLSGRTVSDVANDFYGVFDQVLETHAHELA